MLGGVGVSTPAGPPPPKDITVTRGTEATGSRVQCPGCLVQGQLPAVTEGPGAGPHTGDKEATSDGDGVPTVSNGKMAGSRETWTGESDCVHLTEVPGNSEH